MKQQTNKISIEEKRERIYHFLINTISIFAIILFSIQLFLILLFFLLIGINDFNTLKIFIIHLHPYILFSFFNMLKTTLFVNLFLSLIPIITFLLDKQRQYDIRQKRKKLTIINFIIITIIGLFIFYVNNIKDEINIDDNTLSYNIKATL